MKRNRRDLRIAFNDAKLRFYIGDVRDPDSLQHAMRGVDYVFHAAALKQVPSCEFYPMEALKTNVLGTENILNAATECGVRRVVVLSTDKAVYPINAMGLSKAMAEKVMVAEARTQASRRDRVLCNALRQCHGIARVSDPAFRVADKGGKADYHNRPEHDAVFDVA